MTVREVEGRSDPFSEQGLDPRLVESLRNLGFTATRPVQQVAVPFVLRGTDVMLRAPTGCGKTFAFLLPLLTNSLAQRHRRVLGGGSGALPLVDWRENIVAVVLAPSKELVMQLQKVASDLLVQMSGLVSSVGIVNAPRSLAELMREFRHSDTILITHPGCLVRMGRLLVETMSAPSYQSKHFNNSLQQSGCHQFALFPVVKTLVVDEADLTLDVYGFDEDIRTLFAHHTMPRAPAAGGAGGGGGASGGGKQGESTIPYRWLNSDHMSINKCQVIMCSATLTPVVLELKRMALYKPVFIDVVAASSDPSPAATSPPSSLLPPAHSATVAGAASVASAAGVASVAEGASKGSKIGKKKKIGKAEESVGGVGGVGGESRLLTAELEEADDCVLCRLPERFTRRVQHTSSLMPLVSRKNCDDYLVLYGILSQKPLYRRDPLTKTLIFVNSRTTAVKCQLFLETLKVRVARATGSQPLEERVKAINDFNKAAVTNLILMDTDVTQAAVAGDVKEEEEEGAGHISNGKLESGKMESPKKRQKTEKKAEKKNKEGSHNDSEEAAANSKAKQYSLMSRGLDFTSVHQIILFDPVTSLDDYIHKMGRCGRDDACDFTPTVISLIRDDAAPAWQAVKAEYGVTPNHQLAPGVFQNLRYRVESAVGSLTKLTISKHLARDRSTTANT